MNRLEALLKEQKRRKKQSPADVLQKGATSAKQTLADAVDPGTELLKSWDKFRGLSDVKLTKKLKKLSPEILLDLYRKLEGESGFPVREENYKPDRIIKCFLLLWTAKLKEEQRPKGEKLCPVETRELARAMGPGGRNKPVTLSGLAGKEW